MPALEKKSFDAPDRELRPEKTHGALVDLDGMTVGRYEYAPGWRWVDHIGPSLGSDICVVDHYGYALSGQLRVRHEDGTEAVVGPGEVYHISPRHRGEVVGDEEFVTIEFLPTPRGATRGSALG